jgi:hypothetical protein
MSCCSCPPGTGEQGQAGWPKGAVQAQRNLGGPCQAPGVSPNTRSRAVRSWYRHQAACLRSHQAEIRDICHGDRVAARATIVRQRTSRPVQFEITEPTREAASPEDFLFPSRLHESPHLGSRQYARIVDASVEESGSIRLPIGPNRCAARRRR